MEKKQFSSNDVLNFGWAVMKANLWFFVGVLVVFGIISHLPTLINIGFRSMHLPRELNIISEISHQIVSFAVSSALAIGLTKIVLSFCYEQLPGFTLLFAAKGCFWRYVGVQLLQSLIVLAGLMLLIVPGIIWGIQFSLGKYFVIDQGLGPIEALKASSRTTKGVKGELFVFAIMCMVINLIGMLCLLVGMFATVPMVMVAYALVYRQLLVQTPELAEFGIGNAELETDMTETTDTTEDN